MEYAVKHELERCLHERLHRQLKLSVGQGVWVAFSGGGDSTALLGALKSLGHPVRAVHVDHGWRPESKAWAQHCQEIGARLGVPVEVLTLAPLTPGEGLEDRARRARYGAMAALLQKGDWLLTAHHREDQAETFLLQLLRGAGLEGLAAMPWQRPLGQGFLGRPFLDLERSLLRDYLEAMGLPYLEDPANDDPRFDRARLRHGLFPQLAALGWPQAATQFARAAENLGDALEVQRQWLAAQETSLGATGKEERGLELATLHRLSPAAQRIFLRHWLRRQGGLALPSRSRLTTLQDAIARGGKGGRILQWAGGAVWLQGGRIHALAQTPGPADWETGPWQMGGEPLFIPGWRAGLQTCAPAAAVHALNPALAREALHWRRRRPGESYRSSDGRHRPLKKLLLESAVPPAYRGDVPLLFFGEDQLVLILGYYTAPWAQAQGPEAIYLWRAEGGSA
uniref:tRNA(Ile)-lysidine synthase n=1 Tax=Acidithiobacillus sulfuriphilus TaxID=1867749 RepID=A0A3M8QV38_9PROT|nr:tRNA lysidine(34) synthetase TilS [Acidithiobacillus sulfuriphilus]